MEGPLSHPSRSRTRTRSVWYPPAAVVAGGTALGPLAMPPAAVALAALPQPMCWKIRRICSENRCLGLGLRCGQRRGCENHLLSCVCFRGCGLLPDLLGPRPCRTLPARWR